MIGVYPGSFDPLTTAHLAIADAAVDVLGLHRLDLVLSARALAKEHAGHSTLDERVARIEQVTADRPMRVSVTEQRLIADIAAGYDACVVGADKWHQLHDVAFYDGSTTARDVALARLPTLAVAPRHGVAMPRPGPRLVLLELDEHLQRVSSTAVRSGRHDWRA